MPGLKRNQISRSLLLLLCGLLFFSTLNGFPDAGISRNVVYAGNAAELPIILHTSWHVDPGNALEINGGGFVAGTPETTVVLAQPLTGYTDALDPESAQLSLPVINVQPNLIQAVLPADAPKDVYALWVRTTNGVSDPVFINRAEAFWLSEHTVFPGQNVRLIGRNFFHPVLRDDADPKKQISAVKIELVDPTDQSTVPVRNIQDVTDYTIDFKIPGSAVAGKSYDIRVTNGAGGNYGWHEGMADAEPFAVTGKPAGNPVGLEAAWTKGIPWDKRYNVKDFGARGDGNTDDTAAIQTALDSAFNEGGGVVFLPPGTYNTSSLSIRSKTVLLGVGKDKTTLFYIGTEAPQDDPIPPGREWYYGKSIEWIKGSGDLIGIANLSLTNEVKRPNDDNYSQRRRLSGWVTAVKLNATWNSLPDGGGQGYFVKGVRVRNMDGDGLILAGVSDFIVEDCDVDTTHAAAWVNATDGYFKIRNNTLRNAGRPNIFAIDLRGSTRGGAFSIIEGNRMHGDNWITSPKYMQEPPNAIGEFRYATVGPRCLYFAHNQADGRFGDSYNAGEGLNFEILPPLAYSQATAADSTGLTDDTRTFSPGALKGAKLTIIGGAGVGQMRTIAGNSEHRLEIGETWKIMPDSTSIYSLQQHVNYHNIIVNNTMEAAIDKAAVVFYTSHYDNIIAHNVFRNSGGIWLSANTVKSQNRANFSYFNYVADNEISGAVPERMDMTNHVTIGPFADGGRSRNTGDTIFGTTLVYANEYRCNTLTGVGTKAESLTTFTTANLLYVIGSGIDIAAVGYPTSFPFAQGVLVEDNRVTNTIAGVHLTNVAYDTVLKGNNFTGNGTDIDHDQSVRTFEVTDAQALPAIPYHAVGALTDEGIDLSWESEHAESYKLERADGLTGSFRTIAAGLTDGHYLDTNFKPSLAYMSVKGSFNTPGRAMGLQVQGQYAYVADLDKGLQVIDITDLANPVLAATYDTPGNARGVFVSGSYAYVADESKGLQIIDVSNPSAPILKGSLLTTFAQNVEVSGGYAYVADGSVGLRIIDVSNPAAPKLKATLATGNAYMARVSGNYAYVTASGDLKVVDISNPATPVVVGSLNTPGDARGIRVSGGYVYIADGNSGMQIVDVSSPSSPVLVGTADTYDPGPNDPYGTQSVEVDGGFAFAGNYPGSMKVVDVSDPAHPAIEGSVNTSSQVFGIQKVGESVYVANSLSGLTIVTPDKIPNEIFRYRITARNAFGDSRAQTVKVVPQRPVPACIVFTRARFIPSSTYADHVTVGKTIAAGAQVRDQFNQPVSGASISYTSDNPMVAAVDSAGNITGIAEGVTFVRAAYGDVTEKLIVLVRRLKEVVAVTDRTDLTIGDRAYIRLAGIWSDGVALRIGYLNTPTVQLTSSDPAVVDVDSSNIFYPHITAKQAGTATITATVTIDGITVESNPISVNVTD